jgi:hypothetical protein
MHDEQYIAIAYVMVIMSILLLASEMFLASVAAGSLALYSLHQCRCHKKPQQRPGFYAPVSHPRSSQSSCGPNRPLVRMSETVPWNDTEEVKTGKAYSDYSRGPDGKPLGPLTVE